MYPASSWHGGEVGEGVYPGWGGTGVVGRVLYRYPSPSLPGPIFSHILASRPYPRPYEGLFSIFYEVPQIDLRYTSELTSD